MTNPGWYPDPWHNGTGPAPMRWWDGFTWTAQLQPAPGGGSKGNGPFIALLIGAAVLLVGAVVVGVLMLGGDDEDKKDEAGGNSPSPSESASPKKEPETEAPAGNYIDDEVNGLRIPQPNGLQGTANEWGVFLRGADYPCPALPEKNCIRGGVNVYAAVDPQGSNAEDIAKADIEENAEASYGTDPKDKSEAYGGIKSHRPLVSKPVNVAGEKGFVVRWELDTAKGPDGIVQSVVFPNPHKEGSFLIVRFGFDKSEEAPAVADMDTIVEGIRAIDPDSSGDGTEA